MRSGLAWALYYLGIVFYYPYSKLMLWSEIVQGKGVGPWKDIEYENGTVP